MFLYRAFAPIKQTITATAVERYFGNLSKKYGFFFNKYLTLHTLHYRTISNSE